MIFVDIKLIVTVKAFFSTAILGTCIQWTDTILLLMTCQNHNLSNLEAICLWEGQLHLAFKDGTLRFLFQNKGNIYNSRGFEMLAA